MHSLLDSIYKLCLFLRITYAVEMLPYAKIGHTIVMRKEKRCLLEGSFHRHTKLQPAQVSSAVPSELTTTGSLIPLLSAIDWERILPQNHQSAGIQL